MKRSHSFDRHSPTTIGSFQGFNIINNENVKITKETNQLQKKVLSDIRLVFGSVRRNRCLEESYNSSDITLSVGVLCWTNAVDKSININNQSKDYW